jgi:hypothetical protein
MNAIRTVQAIHRDRAARYHAEARHDRIATEIRRTARVPAGERRVRRAIGRSIVRVGARIAAEPVPDTLVPAGSR